MNDITKRALADAFKNLASKKDVSEITIKEITDKCGLKRQTFYNHFKDKYDLIKWIYLNEVIVKIEHDDCWIEKYRDIFKYFLDNKEMILNIYNCEAQHYLLHFILRESKPIIKNVIDEKSNKYRIKEEDKDFLCFFYSGALGALIINWIEVGMPNNVDEMINKVNLILDGNINNYIKLTNRCKCQK